MGQLFWYLEMDDVVKLFFSTFGKNIDIFLKGRNKIYWDKILSIKY